MTNHYELPGLALHAEGTFTWEPSDPGDAWNPPYIGGPIAHVEHLWLEILPGEPRDLWGELNERERTRVCQLIELDMRAVAGGARILEEEAA